MGLGCGEGARGRESWVWGAVVERGVRGVSGGGVGGGGGWGVGVDLWALGCISGLFGSESGQGRSHVAKRENTAAR